MTTANDSEKQQLRSTLQAQRLYIIDRGSDFIGHLRDNAVWEVVEERPNQALNR